jgi:Flp pilus assembly protein TadD
MLLLAACLTALAGCETTSLKLPEIFSKKPVEIDPETGDPVATGSVSAKEAAAAAFPLAGPAAPLNSLVGADPKGDVDLGKKQYRAGNYGDAEKHFRRAVEASPRDIEAWVGLAASYDRLKRFDLADRAYEQAIKLAGPRPEILNNQGYSYILRGDFKRARNKLMAARARDPANPYIQNNIALLEETEQTGKLPAQ